MHAPSEREKGRNALYWTSLGEHGDILASCKIGDMFKEYASVLCLMLLPANVKLPIQREIVKVEVFLQRKNKLQQSKLQHSYTNPEAQPYRSLPARTFETSSSL